MWYFIIAIFALILLALIFPIRMKLSYNGRHRPKNKKNNVLDDIISSNDSYPNENYIIIYIFYFIPIFKVRLDKNKSKKGKKKKQNKNEKLREKNIASDVLTTVTNFLKSYIDYEKTNEFYLTPKDVKKIHKHLKYSKIDFNLGVNFFEPITNAYLMTIINILINFYLAKNINQINLKKTTYNTYISNEIYNLRLYLVVSVSLITIVFVLARVLFKYLKLKNKIKKTESKSDKKNLKIA